MSVKINQASDVLLVVDVQNDFISGSLAIVDAEKVVPLINQYITKIPTHVFSKDMHPYNHSSFVDQGGPWPPHCVTNTPGAELHLDITFDEKSDVVINKGLDVYKDAYSAFDGTPLQKILIEMGASRLFICGLATDYCVKATVFDALEQESIAQVFLLTDAVEAVNVNDSDGYDAIQEMINAGATAISLDDLLYLNTNTNKNEVSTITSA
jgi:nicotinamidase/pyrazinamidase